MAFGRIFKAVLVIAVIYIIVYHSTSAVDPCPHPNFIANHLCVHCVSLDDAAHFSRYRPRRTMKNSVFFGQPAFETKSYLPDRCGNIDGTKVAICTATNPGMDVSEYNCRWLGMNCYGEHSITTGHLHYSNIKCY